MENTFLITEDNLIGSVATVMLKLKRIKTNTESRQDVISFIEIIKFINTANENDYNKLLYDKNFIVSEQVLNTLHKEFEKVDIASKVNFQALIQMLTEIVKNPIAQEIDIAMKKLKEVIEILLQIKRHKQYYM
jgi:hypothetical protein